MRLCCNAKKHFLLLVFILMYSQQAFSDPVQFTRQELKFPPQAEDTCGSKKVEVVNISNQPISNPGFRIEGSASFSVQRYFRKCPNPLGPGETCRVYVNFCPYLDRFYQALLYFEGTRVFLRMTGEGRIRKF